MAADLILEKDFRRMSEVIISSSRADDVFVSLNDSDDTTLRFANNQVVQHVAVRRPKLTIRAAFGSKFGSASTNRLDNASLISALRQAEQIAYLAPDDPEYLSPLGPQSYQPMNSRIARTANATSMDLAKRTKPVVDQCVDKGLVGAGIMSRHVQARGVAASSGLFGFHESTESRFSLTATGEDSSGWVLNAHRDMDSIDLLGMTRSAVMKALASRNPRELAPGHYPVIFEPAAVAGIFSPFIRSLSAKRYHRGDSPFSGNLNSLVLDPRLTLSSNPDHPDLLGSPFASDGMATRNQTWVEKGVLKQLYYDRFTASKHNVSHNPRPSASVLAFQGETADSVDSLIAQADRAILVTNFWYIRFVDRTDITLTGMTRDGTFLVEDGRIVAGLKNFRFHDSPLRCFKQVDAATAPTHGITINGAKMLLPAVRLPDFHMSSVTKF